MSFLPERTPIRPLRGTFAQLTSVLQQLPDGEFVWARDQDRPYIVRVDGLGVRTLAPGSGGVASLTATGPLSGTATTGAITLSIPASTPSVDGYMSAAQAAKLSGIAANANNYSLPIASLSVLGGVKADGTSVTIDPDGTIHAAGVGGGGSVTTVSGSAPITVTNGTTTPVVAVAAATTSSLGVVQLADAADVTNGTVGRVVDAALLASQGGVPTARTITAGAGLTGGGDLSANRTISANLASQVEAETGTDNVKLMTPLRVAQSVVAAQAAVSINAGTGLSGGGSLNASRTLSVLFADTATAQTATSAVTVMSPVRTAEAVAALCVDSLSSTDNTRPLSANQGKVLADTRVTTARQVIAGTGLSGGGNLSTDRTLAVVFATEGEATAATREDVSMSPLRVSQALGSRVPTSRTISTGAGLSGGGDLSANRTLALAGQAAALHNLATSGIIVRTAADTVAARSLSAGDGIAITNPAGATGNPQISASFASQAQAEAGSLSNVVMSPLRVAQAITALGGTASLSRVTFTASGTFTKDSRDLLYLVEVWGGGASGARSSNTNDAGGGGGGGYGWRILAASEVAGSVTVTVGSGGSAISAIGGANGVDGGTSSFGSLLTVYGGIGGVNGGDGGQGGGLFDPSTVNGILAAQGGFLGGESGQDSTYGGGGGNGGRSIYGGGGGGSATGGTTAGGSSSAAGGGGNGNDSTSGLGGSIPAGGGGGTRTGALSGVGARGEVRVYRLQR